MRLGWDLRNVSRELYPTEVQPAHPYSDSYEYEYLILPSVT